MTDTEMIAIGLVFLAYLWGSIPTAVIVCHTFNIPDPRLQGSGNPGTSNVLRIGSRKAAILTLLGDVGKGVLALLPGLLLQLPDTVQSLCALAAITGHLFPIFSSFRGGKGIATALGVCACLYWPLAIAQLIVWGAITAISRTASLGSIGCTLVSPLFIWLAAPQYFTIMLIISILLLLSHRNNISNLLCGSEPRF